MATSASASDVQKNFGAFHDQALSEPVKVTRYGRESVYIISARTYHELRRSYRRAIGVEELTDEEMALIEAAEVPPDQRYSLSDLD